jgi:small multidrug resistance pump
MLHWLCLAGAIALEIAGTISMKLSLGFTRTLPSVLIDVSVSYAIWSGVGTTAIALIGVYWFRESLTAMQVASIVLIVTGVIGLRVGA